MFKKHIIFVIILFLNISAFSQESKDSKEEGVFNITYVSLTKLVDVKSEIFYLDKGTIASDLSSSKGNAIGLHTITGYSFSPYFSAGIGIGLERFNNPGFNTLPIFIDVRGYLLDKINSPFVFLDYGTFVKLGNQFKRGGLINIGAGYRFEIFDSLKVNSSFSYSHRGVSLTKEGFGKSDNTLIVRGLSLNVGVAFF